MDRSVARGLLAIIAVLFVGLVAGVAFFGGVVVGRSTGVDVPAPVAGLDVDTSDEGDLSGLIDQAKDIMDDEALRPTSDASATIGAMDGLLSSLEDSYAAYFDPKGFEQFKDDEKGEFFGIGITIQLNDAGKPFVVRPFDGTPAKRAGLQEGDVITAIDGVVKEKWDIDDVVKRIRGPKGTKVLLRIERKGKKPFNVNVERDRIVVPNIMKKMHPGKVGYIRLMSFNEQSETQVRDAIEELDRKGAKGYVIDVRENPGGLLSQAVSVSSLFVEDGIIVRIAQRGAPEEQQRSTGNIATKKPVVLLVDSHSASASEILAAALQDHKRATLVGTKTFGKGSVQTIRDLKNGGAIKFTTAHYLSPKGRVIDRKGVTPDIVVKMDIKRQEKESTDTQLQRALAVLRSKL